jgi:hypothetical protein
LEKYEGPTRMITLSETRQALEARQARLTFTKIASRDIRLSSEGLLLAGEQAFTLSLEARDDLARRSGIPAPFFNTIPVDLQAALFNRLFPVTLAHPAAPPELNVAVLDNRVAVALSDATLAVLPGVEVLNAVLEAASTDSNREVLDVAHFGLNGGISLSLVLPLGLNLASATLFRGESMFTTTTQVHVDAKSRPTCTDWFVVMGCSSPSANTKKIFESAAVVLKREIASSAVSATWPDWPGRICKPNSPF